MTLVIGATQVATTNVSFWVAFFAKQSPRRKKGIARRVQRRRNPRKTTGAGERLLAMTNLTLSNQSRQVYVNRLGISSD